MTACATGCLPPIIFSAAVCCCSGELGGEGKMWTGPVDSVLPLIAVILIPFKQLLRCCRSRRLTAGSMPPKRPTSVAHSAKPALNLLSTLGSVACVKINCCLCRSCKCFTVFSSMSAFSNLEWRGCGRGRDGMAKNEFQSNRGWRASVGSDGSSQN